MNIEEVEAVCSGAYACASATRDGQRTNAVKKYLVCFSIRKQPPPSLLSVTFSHTYGSSHASLLLLFDINCLGSLCNQKGYRLVIGVEKSRDAEEAPRKPRAVLRLQLR